MKPTREQIESADVGELRNWYVVHLARSPEELNNWRYNDAHAFDALDWLRGQLLGNVRIDPIPERGWRVIDTRSERIVGQGEVLTDAMFRAALLRWIEQPEDEG